MNKGEPPPTGRSCPLALPLPLATGTVLCPFATPSGIRTNECPLAPLGTWPTLAGGIAPGITPPFSASRRARHIEEVEACAPIAAADFGSAIVPTSIRSPKGGKAIAGGKAMAGGKALATKAKEAARNVADLAKRAKPGGRAHRVRTSEDDEHDDGAL